MNFILLHYPGGNETRVNFDLVQNYVDNGKGGTTIFFGLNDSIEVFEISKTIDEKLFFKNK